MIRLFEEFENKNSYILYHSTNSDFFKEPEENRDGRYYNPLGTGIYCSSIKSYSKRFGKNTYVYLLPKNSKILFINKNNWEEIVQTWINLKIIYQSSGDPPIGILNNFTYFLYREFNNGYKESEVQDLMEEVSDEFNSEYDAIWYSKDLYNGKEDEIVIPFNKFRPEYFHEKLSKKLVPIEESVSHNLFLQALDKLNIKYDRFNILKNGAYGVAIDIGFNKILKITNDPSEAETMSWVKENPNKGIVDVFDVFHIENSGRFPDIITQLRLPYWDDTFFIVEEKVNTSMAVKIDNFLVGIKKEFGFIYPHRNNDLLRYLKTDRVVNYVNEHPEYKEIHEKLKLMLIFQLLIWEQIKMVI
jgi:hypothetical protein